MVSILMTSMSSECGVLPLESQMETSHHFDKEVKGENILKAMVLARYHPGAQTGFMLL